jgi:hypothetical protein
MTCAKVAPKPGSVSHPCPLTRACTLLLEVGRLLVIALACAPMLLALSPENPEPMRSDPISMAAGRWSRRASPWRAPVLRRWNGIPPWTPIWSTIASPPSLTAGVPDQALSDPVQKWDAHDLSSPGDHGRLPARHVLGRRHCRAFESSADEVGGYKSCRESSLYIASTL